MDKKLPKNKLVVFFDGNCALCNKTQRNNENFLFCQQSRPLFQITLNSHKISLKDIDSIVVSYNEKIYIQIKATILILKNLSKPWCFLAFFIKIFPLSLSNYLYKSVAKNRKKLNSRLKESCPIVPEKWKNLFISNESENFEQKTDLEK